VKKSILYIDVDGVLFGEYNGFFQLRPNVLGFLDWCNQYFECRWLTCWGKDQLESLSLRIYGEAIFKKIKYIRWCRDGDYSHKTQGINFNEDWFWIDDELCKAEKEDLESRGMLDRHIKVNDKGQDELKKVQKRLEDIISLEGR
jgi:squalene cyclase